MCHCQALCFSWCERYIKRVDPKHIEDLISVLSFLEGQTEVPSNPKKNWDKLVRRSLAWLKVICAFVASEKVMAPHASTLSWKISWVEEPGRLQSMGLRRVGHDWATSLSLFTFMHWRKNGNPLQCSCLENPRDGEPGGLPSMGSTESDTTETT